MDKKIDKLDEFKVENDFYYTMSQKEFNHFKSAIKNLSKGDDYKKIIETIGEPYSDKFVRGKQFNAPILSRDLFYYVKRYEKDFVNEYNDLYVIIVLDNNKLIKIRSNCPEIKEAIPNLLE